MSSGSFSQIRRSSSKLRSVPVHDAIGSESQSCAPPVSDSRGGAQVTGRTALVTDSAQMDESDRALSPAYLSVGSDDGSVSELYYSAQEDDAESGGEEPCRGGGRKETAVERQGDEAASEEGGRKEPQQAGGQRSEDPPQGGKREVKEGWERRAGRGEELLVPPVQQVSRPLECDSAPPPAELQGAGPEGNQTPQTEEDQPLPLPGRGLPRSPVWSPEETRGSELAAGSGSICTETLQTHSIPEGAGPVADSPEGAGPVADSSQVRQQVPVEPSDPTAAARRPDREAADTHRSLPASASAPARRQESLDKMSLGLSTELSTQSSSLPEDDPYRYRVHAASLITEGDGGRDSAVSQSNPADPKSEHKWKNRFEGVTQYKPKKTVGSPSSLSAEMFTPGSSLNGSTVSLSGDGAAAAGGWSLSEQVEPAAGGWSLSEQVEPAAGEGEGRAERIKSGGDSQQLTASCSNTEDDESFGFSGVLKATLVELIPDPASPDSPGSPHHLDMDTLVDTLKSMGPSLRPRTTGLRAAAPAPVSCLPPIVEDAVTSTLRPSVSSPAKVPDVADSPSAAYTLPADLGLKRSVPRDARPPLQLMKNGKDVNPPVVNGNGALLPPTSRLDSSVLFGGYGSSDQTLEKEKAHRPLLRTGSLPEKTSSSRLGGAKEPGEVGARPEPAGSRLERLSFLLNSPPSLTGTDDSRSAHMSRPPSLSIGSPASNSPTRLLSPTGSVDLHRSFPTTDASMFGQGLGALGSPILQRSLSADGSYVGVQSSLLNNVHGGPQFQFQQQEAEQSMVSKYRAFPDAYLTKEKEHGKLNPRPGKMYIFDQPGMCGQRIEVLSDVIDATPWELQETISIRVVRGGWVLYEKPNFKGEKIALDEGDIELTCPFSLPEEPNGPKEPKEAEPKPARRFIIGSVRRAVRDYSVPEICLFPEEDAEGKKVVFRDTSEDARIFGFPIKANSIIINAGLWLVYAQPFFQGVPRVLEVGGYPNPAAWGVEQPYVGSLHPLKVGEPRVENSSEPKMVIYDKPYFSGKSRTVSANMKDFMTRADSQQTVFMYSVGSLKVLGGIWVGYEKEGFRGHQYLLEEGEYHDWRVWGGCDSELRSARILQADLTEPLMVLFEQPEEEEGMLEENTFEVTEAIPDVELFGFQTSTRSIHVLSGVWVAYSHVDFSGSQHILEKGFYSNCADWGSQDTRICSVQPVLQAPLDSSRSRQEIILYSEPNFQGQCHIYDQNQQALPGTVLTRSCRVVGGSWVLFEENRFSGNMYVVSEGDYSSLPSMGCPPGCSIHSLRPVPMMFSVPSISLFGLEGLEGREVTTDSEVLSLVQEGFNSHVLSVRVNSGCWVLCEHTNYRGRQFLLEPIEITNWPKFSSLQAVGSMYPVTQKRHFFRVRNTASGHFLSVQGGVEEMKSGRVVAAEQVEPLTDIWFYQDGLIKNKVSPTMSLQVIGNMEPAAMVVLWTETRQPIQTWTAQMRGLISSLVFPGMVLDVKGGKAYDRDHAVVMPESDERPSQQWQMELL
ncbi:uncharacterized protein crybg2 [Odontesthes bonariensis]|uniref:uncharacterized protein crybg2 n=1 Tax=Odontesthes bonariensis TaxID=219752 RepID=UPI003F58C29B